MQSISIFYSPRFNYWPGSNVHTKWSISIRLDHFRYEWPSQPFLITNTWWSRHKPREEGDMEFICSLDYITGTGGRLRQQALPAFVSDVLWRHISTGEVPGVTSAWPLYLFIIFLFVFCLSPSFSIFLLRYTWDYRMEKPSQLPIKTWPNILLYALSGVILAYCKNIGTFWAII